MSLEEAAQARIKQLRELAAEIEPSTVEADAVMRAYLDDADLLEAQGRVIEAQRVALKRIARSYDASSVKSDIARAALAAGRETETP